MAIAVQGEFHGEYMPAGVTIKLEQGNAGKHCHDLMRILEEKNRIDFEVPEQASDPRLSLDYLFGEARGQMFGILECADADGEVVILKAFSGQYNGIWKVEGWVPPLFNVDRFDELVCGTDHKIKELGNQIDRLPEGEERRLLAVRRKKMSQNLMKEIHALYHVFNFRSQAKPLSDFFPHGIPTGAGDCCAPKLLNHAARTGLKPVGLAEFFWGRSNRSGTRRHSMFYLPCTEKCLPILGFMMQGMEPQHG
ncbi:MAG: hypothetical protein C4522_09675 [Desulfobacteraceae bacterium]|nr:MAG: hypothetical protein C4522_09675 [Desulfobacteraceae bacterium]